MGFVCLGLEDEDHNEGDFTEYKLITEIDLWDIGVDRAGEIVESFVDQLGELRLYMYGVKVSYDLQTVLVFYLDGGLEWNGDEAHQMADFMQAFALSRDIRVGYSDTPDSPIIGHL